MTKAQVIRDLFNKGIKESKRIASLTGFEMHYVCHVVCDLRNPGRAAAWRRNYWKRKGRGSQTKYNTKWLKDHPEAARRLRRRQWLRRQKKTRVTAFNNGGDWTTRQLKFLRNNRGRMSVDAMAAALGRTYFSVRRALTVYALASYRPRKVDADWSTPEYA